MNNDYKNEYSGYSLALTFNEYRKEEEIIETVRELEAKNDNTVFSLHDSREVKDNLHRIRFIIKELGRIFRQYKDLKITGKGSTFYNSYNHYYRLAKLCLDELEPIEFFGRSSKPLNPEIGEKVKKNVCGIQNFCFKLELIEKDKSLKDSIKREDREQIKELNKKLFDLVPKTLNFLTGQNYFKYYDSAEMLENLSLFEEPKGINNLFELPENENIDFSDVSLLELEDIVEDKKKELIN